MCVGVRGGRVGDGVRGGEPGVRDEAGGAVPVAETGVGVCTKPGGVWVGVGVGRNIPPTTKSVPCRRPSSRRIAFKAIGFMGATAS